MPSKYYTPPTPLQPNTTAHAGAINSDFTGVDSAFQLVAADMALTFSHATLSITPLNQSAGTLAGKNIGFDSTGLALVAVAGIVGVWKGTWVTATSYNLNDVVKDPNSPFSIYYALKNFTSGANVAADVAAARLALAIDLTNQTFNFVISTQVASFNAAVGNLYLINAGAGNIVMTLPAGAGVNPGQLIAVSIHPNFTHNLTLAPTGTDLIDGVNANALMYSSSGAARAAQIYWSGATNGWITQ